MCVCSSLNVLLVPCSFHELDTIRMFSEGGSSKLITPLPLKLMPSCWDSSHPINASHGLSTAESIGLTSARQLKKSEARSTKHSADQSIDAISDSELERHELLKIERYNTEETELLGELKVYKVKKRGKTISLHPFGATYFRFIRLYIEHEGPSSNIHSSHPSSKSRYHVLRALCEPDQEKFPVRSGLPGLGTRDGNQGSLRRC